MTKRITLLDKTGTFAENKDMAKQIRLTEIIPALNEQEKVILDFKGVSATTQSFVHALISDVIRQFGIDVLDRLFFENCNDVIKGIINIVVEYMQDKEFLDKDK